MMGMEKMLGSMIGLSPEQMKAKAEEFERMFKDGTGALVAIAQTVAVIRADQTRILDHLGLLVIEPAQIEGNDNGPE